jgi:hypothetical protein
MRQNKIYRALAFLCAVAVTLAASLMSGSDAVYASDTLINKQSQTASALTEITHVFNVTSKADVEFSYYVPKKTTITLTIYDANGSVYGNTHHLTSAGAVWVADGKGWYTTSYTVSQMPKGTYKVVYTFDEAITYDFKVTQLTAEASLQATKLTLTQGFSQKIKINNGKAKSWSSSKKSVATVSSNGTVKGKKAGKAVITVKLTSGKKLKCTVTVKSNSYSAKKITSDYVGINEYGIKAYSASYKSNGSLCIKFRVVNETENTIASIPQFHLTAINQKSETIINYSKSSYKVNVSAHSSKDFTLTIPKSSISGSKADLRNTVIQIEGNRV